MKSERETIYRNVPKVNRKSAKIVEGKKDKDTAREVPVHERLHGIHQDKIQRQVEKIQNKQVEIKERAQASRYLK